MKRRLLCALLALLLCVGLLPMTALAASDEPALAADPVEEPVEEAVEETDVPAASEEPAAEAAALANVETEAPALDGDTAGYAAVTGDAVIENGVVTISGSFTKPETEAAYGCLLRYSTDFEEHYSGYGMNYREALSSNVVSWTMDRESHAEILPGVTYYYYAVIEDADDHDVVTGEVKSFVGPTDGVKTIQVGQNKTVAAGTTAYYSFTPTADGVYSLNYDEAGMVRVYVSTGDVLELDYLSEENVGVYAGLASFVATAGQTYYIEVQSQGSTALSFTLSKEAALTEFKAVTGNASISGSSVTVSGTFTKPFTTGQCIGQIYVALSEEALASIATVAATGYICDGVEAWTSKGGSANVSEWSLLIPGVTYYYCAVVAKRGYGGEEVVARGAVKHFVAPERDFETLEDGKVKQLDSEGTTYCSFEPTGDGEYELRITDGEGMVFVIDSTGAQVAWGSRSVYLDYNDETGEQEEVCNETPASFMAEAGKTYYIMAYSYDGSNMSLLATNTSPAHSWDEGEVTTDPTCTEKGVKTYTCTDCGETKTEDVPALGHDWDDGAVTTEPTCTEKGVKTYTCSVCRETKTEDVATLDHSWDEGVVTLAPTTKEEGEKTYTCSVCTGTKTEKIARLTVAEALDKIDADATAEDIRDAVQEIDGETLSEAMSGKDSAEVIEKIKELEEKLDGSFTVVVTEEAAEAGVSDQVTVVGARLNDLKATGADVVLTIDVAKQALTLPSGLSDENAVYLEIALSGVANASALTVPVYITLAVPEAMDAQKVRLVHYGADGTEVLLPVQLVKDEAGVWYASFVVSGFSPFALAEVVQSQIDTEATKPNGNKTNAPKTGDESHLVLWAVVLLAACGGTAVVVKKKKEN